MHVLTDLLKTTVAAVTNASRDLEKNAEDFSVNVQKGHVATLSWIMASPAYCMCRHLEFAKVIIKHYP